MGLWEKPLLPSGVEAVGALFVEARMRGQSRLPSMANAAVCAVWFSSSGAIRCGPQRFASTWLASTWSSRLAPGGGATFPERIFSGVTGRP